MKLREFLLRFSAENFLDLMSGGIMDIFNGWKFIESRFSHLNTLGLGNYRGHLFVTGCDDLTLMDTECLTATEILSPRVTDGKYWFHWRYAPDYPFAPNFRSVYFFYRMVVLF